MDGPLTLEVRYPGAHPIAVADSVSLWGTVGSGRARLRVNGRPVRIAPNGGFATFLPLPPGDAPVLRLEASKGRDTLRRTVVITRLRSAAAVRGPRRATQGWIRLRRLPSDTVDSATQARPVYARWTPAGALALQLPLGAILPINQETDQEVRVLLAPGLMVWVTRGETEPIAAPRRGRSVLGELALRQDRARTVLTLEAPDLLPSSIEAVGTQMRWTIYGARAGPARPVESADGFVRHVATRDRRDGRVIVELQLTTAPLGWRTAWRDGKAILELRSSAVNGPGLDGLVVALDPGHPPEGAIGPTGLTEDSVNLAVAVEAAARLRALGARPMLTRTTGDPLSLEARIAGAEAADAELFVSIHANAPGDGRPPESVDGTRVYWWHPHALSLARALRDSVPAATGQLRVGTVQSNLAVLRATWFPAALVEVTAIVLPEREAWLRSPEGVAAQAAGIVAGIRAWHASRPHKVADHARGAGSPLAPTP